MFTFNLDPVILSETYSLKFSEIVFRIKLSGVYYLFCARYHPQKPKYNYTQFTNMLYINIESLMYVNDRAFIFAGDLNKLNCKHN